MEKYDDDWIGDEPIAWPAPLPAGTPRSVMLTKLIWAPALRAFDHR